MTIDWITVGAQIANFLVLVWLLRRFLYRPILDGIDAREAEIRDRMQEAVRAKEQAQSVEEAFHEKTRALSVAQAGLTETIRKSAEQQRDILLADARKRLDEEQAAWKAQLEEGARKYATRMHRAGAEALLALTRKAVSDLADETFETRMAEQFVRQLDAQAPDLKRAAGAAVEAVVTSHAALPQGAQDDLTAALRGLFPKIALRFETSQDQSPGLVLQLGGAQLVWTVASYIDDLEAMIHEALTPGAQPKGQTHAQ